MFGNTQRQEAYDFLYVDTKRIARLLAQFDGLGVATQNSREVLDKATVGGEGNIFLLKLNAEAESESKAVVTYDPSWRLPIEFANLAKGDGFKQLDKAKPGDIIVISGHLALRDYEFLNDVQKAKGVGTGPAPELPRLPFLIHASISQSGRKTWSTLNAACTTASTGDLALKFGTNIPGIWTLIGVLDDGEFSTEANPLAHDAFDGAVEDARQRFGRPEGASGVTPLLIYRVVRI